MKLTYRGVSYDYTPDAVPKLGPAFATGVYRGAGVAFNALEEVPAQPSADLTWRGVAYHSGDAAPSPEVVSTPAPVDTPPVVEPVAAALVEAPIDVVAMQARNLFLRHHQRSRKREQGMMVRLAKEVGIPVEDAANYESHVQGKLPHDFSGYGRSSSAMS